MGEMAFEVGAGGRFNGYKLDPDDDVRIPGVDPGYGPEHPRYQVETAEFWARLQAGEFEDDLATYVKYGQIMPAEIVKERETGMAIPVKGRKRCLFLRVANQRRKAQGLEPWKFWAINELRGTSQIDSMAGTLIENSSRYTLNAMEWANNAFHFLSVNGDTDETRKVLKTAIKIDDRRLDDLLNLRSASPKIHKAIQDKGLDLTAAIALAAMGPEKQAAELERLQAEARLLGKKKVTVAQARAARHGGHVRPGQKQMTKVIDQLKGLGRVPDETLNILRFSAGLCPLSETSKVFQDCWAESQKKGKKPKATEAKPVAKRPVAKKPAKKAKKKARRK